MEQPHIYNYKRYDMICIYVHHIHVCVYIYNYIHTYIYVTGEILVKGWRLLSEECLSFRKNAAHFEDSRNLKQYRLHHVQGNSAFFSQKCCALLDIFLHTATRHSLTSKRHAFTNAHDMLKDYIYGICCIFSREETGLSWNSMYCIWQQTFLKGQLYVKGPNLKGNTVLFICVDTVYLERLIES